MIFQSILFFFENSFHHLKFALMRLMRIEFTYFTHRDNNTFSRTLINIVFDASFIFYPMIIEQSLGKQFCRYTRLRIYFVNSR